jgi:hypothetical protein
MSAGRPPAQNSDMEMFDIKKQNDVEFIEQYQVKISRSPIVQPIA